MFEAVVFPFEIQYRTNLALFTLVKEQVSCSGPSRNDTELVHHIQQTPNGLSSVARLVEVRSELVNPNQECPMQALYQVKDKVTGFVFHFVHPE